ncbi:MAG: beta-ketoacyl synthase N-terminal-like domain-containing protein, partial [Pseudomonadota bacterium]
MKTQLPFDLKIPVLYVNPALNADGRLIEEVYRRGGLGFVDRYLAPDTDITIPEGVPYGIRCSLRELEEIAGRPGAKIVLIPLEEIDSVASLDPGKLRDLPIPCLVEVGNAGHARAAEAAGAAGLVARGNEGPGWVSETNGFVLLQEVLDASDLPVFLRGGIGIRTARGAVAAGAVGVVLDVHLLLAADSALDKSLKEFLAGLCLPATTLLAEASGSPCRVYARIGTRKVRELRKAEETHTPGEYPSYRELISSLLSKPTPAPDSDEALIPLSEDIVEAKRLAAEFGSAGEITAEFGARMSDSGMKWPFSEEAQLLRDHRTRYPIVQGPMAHVSDNPEFLAAVARNGALPFLAMGNMPRSIAEEGIRLAREKTDGWFGVGLIGLDVNQNNYEAHLEIMRQDPPPFAILAAGGVELARRIEQQGTTCYLHCPAPTLVSEGIKAGLRHFVFEGCESGGHIGLLGSLDLWNANLRELDQAVKQGPALNEVSVLFAGGIGSGRAAAFIAGMVADLAEKGLKVGFQVGTAYLATEEAVTTCAITDLYRKVMLGSDRTTVIGRTVNIKARGAQSPMATLLLEREYERVREGLPLRDRKLAYEKDNLGALRLASKGCAIDPQTATWDCPVFCDLTTEEQLDRGLYLMGQVVAVLKTPTTMSGLHESFVTHGRAIFESRPVMIEAGALEHEAIIEADTPMETELDKEPIAIVGIGLTLPGSDSPESFWEQIIQGRSGIMQVPPERWGNRDYYYDPDPKIPDKTYSRIGGFVTELGFDPISFRIPPSVAQKMDRTQQMAVVGTAKALADAGLKPEDLKGKRVGIIIGNSMGGETTDLYAARLNLPRAVDCLDRCCEEVDVKLEAKEALMGSFKSAYLKGLPQITEDSLPGELANVISGRIANVFNLEGPNFTVDAACASSMAAVMNAIAALRSGSIDFAVSGGVDGAMHPSSFIKFCKVGALSPDGSRPFDEGANGFVMGEGVGIMVLKRLSDALRDGDRIYATILDVGSSSDGRGKGITAPNAAGQVRALKACFSQAGVSAKSVGLVEAHGTSTPVGDKTEVKVLDEFFKNAGSGKHSVGIGSVKSQLGHLKAAAGAAGMIKACLSLYHKTLPPTINIKNPTPAIDWNESPLYLLTEGKPWNTTNGYPRRAGVSAFGFGGTNFHVLMQEHVPGLRVVTGGKRAEEQPPAVVEAPDWPTLPDMNLDGEAWVIGGKDLENLNDKIGRIIADLKRENAVRTAAEYRGKAGEYRVRCGFAARSADEALAKLTLIREGIKDPKKRMAFGPKGISLTESSGDRVRSGVAFLFPGQGSQYPYMLRDLAQRFPIVARTFREADEILTGLGLGSLTQLVFPGAKGGGKDDGDALKDTQVLQPMILTANTALFRLLEQLGVRPAACAGHSLGEYAACVAAGVFSFRDALEAVAVRGREMSRVSIADPGLMMSVPADARFVEEVLAEVDGYVVAANKNSPKQTVISGETDAVKQAGKLFQARGMEVVILPVSAAFHSGVVAPGREPFMKTLRKLQVNPPSTAIMSNVTGDFYPVGPAAPEKIRDLLGKQFAAPVEWVKTLRRLYNDGIRIFVECGPKRVLTNLTVDCVPNDALAVPTNHPKKGGIMQLMETLAALAVEGVSIDFDAAATDAVKAFRPVPRLRIVSTDAPAPQPAREVVHAPSPLDPIMDDELREMTNQSDFTGFLAIQSDPVRSLIKASY